MESPGNLVSQLLNGRPWLGNEAFPLSPKHRCHPLEQTFSLLCLLGVHHCPTKAVPGQHPDLGSGPKANVD